MERHVLAHELGHAILHPKTNITYLESNTFYSKEKFEIAANTFAAELLIEDSLFHEYKHHTIEEMAAVFYTSDGNQKTTKKSAIKIW